MNEKHEALQACLDFLTDSRIGTYQYMESHLFYEDVAKVVETIRAALNSRDDPLERLVQMVIDVGGLSTGHADTPEQLMEEVLWQVKELRGKLKAAKEEENRQLREALRGLLECVSSSDFTPGSRILANARETLKSTESEPNAN